MTPAMRTCRTILLIAALIGARSVLGASSPQRDRLIEEVIVVAPYGTSIARDRVPASVQSASAEDIDRARPLDLTELLDRAFGSVNINHAQNNPLQPDVNFRGFTASPLLGLSPGLTVYQNGIRINEPFGDTVNWDLLPLSAIDSVQLLAGTQPVFGLNTLGGALSLRMKDGFGFRGTEAEASGGSFMRRALTAEHGGNNGRWGYYGDVDYFEEDGWRDHSASEALRFFGALSLRSTKSTLDLSISLAETELRGNGAAPAELLAMDRGQVFTQPDITENSLSQIVLEASRQLGGGLKIGGNAFYRDIDTDTFNGDGTPFEECDIGGDELLVEETFTDIDGDGECSSADAGIEPVIDLAGEPIEAELDGEERDAINNIGRREQQVYGASLQLEHHSSWSGRDNDLILGATYSEGHTTFDSNVEVASLQADRSTSRTGIFARELITGIDGDVTVASLYFVDTLDLSDRATVTLAGRYNSTRVRLEDQTAASPELNGSHEFERFNPAAGLTFQVAPRVTAYASYGQSARAPTPVELACASEDAPCNLPNAFLADPPLEQVVATSVEAGLRGALDQGLTWRAGVFRTVSEDDILFQTTGGTQANVGFFANVGDTRRQGLELGISRETARWRWHLEYSLIEATFEESFVVNSPNHPIFVEDPDAAVIAGDGKLHVTSGDVIPGIPRHQANVGVDLLLGERFNLGADVAYRSGVYLRGDEANLLDKTDAYAIVNVRAGYRVGERVTLLARIENVLDEDYETFGLLGEPGEVFEDFTDPRFYGAGPPIGAWLGVKVQLD